MTPEEIIKHHEWENSIRKEIGLPSLEEAHQSYLEYLEDKKNNPEKYPTIPVTLPKLK